MTTQLRRGGALCALCVVAAISSGCGVGAGVMAHQVDLGAYRNQFGNSDPRTRTESDLSMVTPVIQLYDATGFLVAALGTAGNQYNAQQQALRDAADRPIKPGEEIEYSYKVVPPSPGMLTSLTFSWGSTDVLTAQDTSGGPEAKVPATVDFFLFDLNVNMFSFDITDTLWAHIALGALWRSYDISSARFGGGSSWIGMPLTLRLSYDLPESGVTANAYIGVDPIVSPIVALVGNDGDSWFWMRSGLRADVGLLSWMNVSVDGYYEVSPMELGSQDSDSFNALVSLNVFFGGGGSDDDDD